MRDELSDCFVIDARFDLPPQIATSTPQPYVDDQPSLIPSHYNLTPSTTVPPRRICNPVRQRTKFQKKPRVRTHSREKSQKQPLAHARKH